MGPSLLSVAILALGWLSAPHPAWAGPPSVPCPVLYAQAQERAPARVGASFLEAEIAPLHLSPEDRARAERLDAYLRQHRRLPNENHPGERPLHNDIDLGLRTAAPFLNGISEEARAVLQEAPLYRRLRGRFQRDLRDFLEDGPTAAARPGLRDKYDFWRRFGEKFDEEGRALAERFYNRAKPRAPVTLAIDAEGRARARALDEYVKQYGALPTRSQDSKLSNAVARGLEQALPFLAYVSDDTLALIKASPRYVKAKEAFEDSLAFYRRVKPGAPLRPDQERSRLVWEAMEARPAPEAAKPELHESVP